MTEMAALTRITETNGRQEVAAYPTLGVFENSDTFEHAQRVATMLVASKLAPENFHGKENLGSAVIALDMALRLRMNPLMVMQQIYIVYGKPGWSSQFIIACLNASGKFSPLRFEMTGAGEDRQCVAWAVERETGQKLEGPPVSIAMARKEGWVTKNGSKWQTMPELMLRYRAATWFGRLYAPELLMGLQAVEELQEAGEEPRKEARAAFGPVKASNEAKRQTLANSGVEVVVEPDAPQPITATESPSPQSMLCGVLSSHGVTFDEFHGWLKVTNLFPVNFDDIDSFETVPTAVAEALLKQPKTLNKCVKIYGKGNRDGEAAQQ